MKSDSKFDVIIAGGGLAGLTMANSLVKSGRKIALVSPQMQQADGRSTALLAHSIEFLESLDVWSSAKPKAAAMNIMRLIDNTDRLIHAPEVSFNSMEIGLEAFGYNILNADLSAVLSAKLTGYGNFTRIDGKITQISETGSVTVTLETGEALTSAIIIGADGRNSMVRRLANNGNGIETREWAYPQAAIVLNFEHTLPHGGASTEFHTPSGPFTVVPLAQGLSSLVWVVAPHDAPRIKDGKRQVIEREIEEQMHSILGKIKIVTDIQSFPLSGMSARHMAVGRCFLVGDAAHGFPPIGAQGYNLGVRDIEELTRLMARESEDPARIADQYNANRKTDVTSRTISVDLFNRSLLTDFLPVQFMRSTGIMALGEIGALRKIMMREGVSPGLGLRGIGDGLREFARSFRTSKTHS